MSDNSKTLMPFALQTLTQQTDVTQNTDPGVLDLMKGSLKDIRLKKNSFHNFNSSWRKPRVCNDAPRSHHTNVLESHLSTLQWLR